MQLGWGALALIIVGAALAWFWQDSLAARESANLAALDVCRQLGLQLLDGTVAFARLALTRDGGRVFKLRRTYVFDYTATSIERRQGFVVVVGHRIESVGYAPGETARATVAAAAAPEAPLATPPRAGASGKSNVIDFEQGQRRRDEARDAGRRGGE